MKRSRRTLLESLECRLLLSHAELIRNGAFEEPISGANWVTTGAWTVNSGSQYHGGSRYAYFANANGTAGNNLSGTLYQQVTIPVDAVNPTLTFWSKITTSETTTTQQKDVMTVQIRDAGGTQVLQSLKTLSNLNAVSTAGPHTAAGRYTLHTIALSPSLIGQTVRVVFSATTDSSLPTLFRVDDVGLSEPIPTTPGTSDQVVGYLPYYRQSLFSQMDLSQVTHINYFAITASETGALSTSNVNNNSLATVVNAAHARGIGVSITVGPHSFSAMAANPSARATFATNIKNYIVARNLDGVDIDWEPPGNGIDQVNYGLLIHDLYAQLNPIGKKVTAAVNPWTKEIPVAATQLMDWVNIMAYDMHHANHSTYAASIDAMNQWHNYGVAKDKLVMGVPFYGRAGTSWSDNIARTYGAIVNDYRAINGVDLPPNVDSYVDSDGRTFFFNGITTMQNKMTFVRDNGFAGAMIWELGQDHWQSGQYTSFSMLPVVATVRRPAVPSVPELLASSDSGISNSDNITNITTPTFTGSAPVGATVTLYANGVARGSGVANASGAWTITVSSPLANGVYEITATATTGPSTSDPSEALVVVIDTIAPVVTASAFDYLTEQVVRFEFSKDLGGTFTLADLHITNLTTNTDVPSDAMTLAQSGDVYRVRFGGVSGGILSDGDYTAVIAASGVTDVAGNALQTGGTTLDFFVLAGDATRDRIVNLADFNILAANFGQSPRNFSQGDFNYDGVVNLADFNILAAKFGFVLSGNAVAGRSLSGAASPFASTGRIIDSSGTDDAVTEALR